MGSEITGDFGYITNTEGHIICKWNNSYEPLMKPGYNYTKLASKEELDAIEIYKNDEGLCDDLVADELRQIASVNLKNKGYMDDNGNITPEGKEYLQNQ